MPSRAKLPPGEGKRVPLNMRTTQETRDRLAKAAADSGRSLVQEVEYRLERSFLDEDARDREMGGKGLHALFRLLGAAAEIIEARTGKNWSEDWDTGMAVFSAWQRLLVDAMPKTPAAVQKTIQILAGPTEELSVPDLAQVRQLLNEHPGTEMTDEDLQMLEEAMKGAGKLFADELQVRLNLDATTKQSLLARLAAMSNRYGLIRRSKVAENIGREAVLGLFPEKEIRTSTTAVRGRNAKGKKA